MIGKKFTSELTVLLTSTIIPPGAQPNKVKERREQYESALTSWLLNPDPRVSSIVYCDNSSPDLEWTYELAAQYGKAKKFEAIFCPDNNMPDGMHYGYPELGIIDYATQHSQLIRQYAYFVKVTGRLQFPKFSNLLDSLPASFDSCIDFRSAYRHERKVWSKFRARTQLMIFKRAYYIEHLLGKRSLMIDNKISHIEESIAGLLPPPGNKKNTNIIFRFPIECPPSGIGGNGDDYDSVRRRMKSLISGCNRRIFPWHWL